MDALNGKRAIDNRLKAAGLSGIALGALALLACELPAILGILGLATLAAGSGVLRPPVWLETLGILVAVAGIIALVVFFARRRHHTQEK